MTRASVFYPPRMPALVFQALALALLLLILPFAVLFSLRAALSWQIALGMGLVLLDALAALHLIYQIYALTHAAYRITENALHLQWGLRQEIIPSSDISWVRPSRAVTEIQPPRRTLFGIWRQRQNIPGFGQVEYLASRGAALLVVSCAEKHFVISPQNAADFVETLRKTLEIGSLQPSPGASFYPGQLARAPLRHPWARFLWTFTIALNLGFLLWLSLLLPGGIQIPAGYDAYARPLAAVPLRTLLWLPLMSLVTALADWLWGLLLYADPARRPWAWALWLSAALQSALYLLAFYLLLATA